MRPPAAPPKELVPLASLSEDPANARKHNSRNLDVIKGSLARFGQQKPIVVDRGNVVRAGNGTLRAAKALGWEDIWITRTDLTGAELTAFALADNRSAELAEWDDDVLLQTLSALPTDLQGFAGFDATDLAQMFAPPQDDAALLKRLGVTLAEPEHVCVRGDIYELGGRHTLVVADVLRDFALWGPYLETCDLFCPYAGLFLPLSLAAQTRRLLLVQPHLFLAGHLLDKWTLVHTADTIRKVREAA